MNKRFKIRRIYASPFVTYLIMGIISLVGITLIATTIQKTKDISGFFLHFQDYMWGTLIAFAPIAFLIWTNSKATKEEKEIWRKKHINLDIVGTDEIYSVYTPTKGVYKHLRFSPTGELLYINTPLPYCLHFESAPDPIIFFENIKKLNEESNSKKITIVYMMYKAKLEDAENESIKAMTNPKLKPNSRKGAKKPSINDYSKITRQVSGKIGEILSKIEAPEEEIFQKKYVIPIEKSLTIEFKSLNEKEKFLEIVENEIIPNSYHT